MLYVFHVDTGTMLTFDMSLAMQSVVHLQDAIMKKCHIPPDKQVLLISGGDNLDPSARVCSYSAGTDSNPIFLFSKLSIEAATPPTLTGNFNPDTGLLSKLESSLHMPAVYETIAQRAQLSLQLKDVARDMYMICQCLVHDQHLQHQGWAAVTANLDDITSAFRSRTETFLKSYDDYLSTRDDSLAILSTFESVTDLLNTLPLVPCLSPMPVSDAKTLLEWINAQDKRNTLEQMVQQCQTGIDQFDSKLRDSLAGEINTMLAALDNPNMIEVKGVEERLSRLEHMMVKAKECFDDISNSALGLAQNQTRARSLKDTTVIPDLCIKHREVLNNMLSKFQLLQDLLRRIIAAKDELSANLHTRLRWIMLVEKSLCDLDSRLVIRHETLKKIKHRIEILRQIHSAPVVYCRAISEVVRRKQFSSQFVKWSDNVYEKYSRIQSREKELRDQFETCIGKHFLRALFPGFDDKPPSFMSKLTTEFDSRLPDVTRADIEYILHVVPQLADELRVTSEDFTVLSVNGEALPILCDLSSQSVEIISHEESHLLKLESLKVPSSKQPESPDNGRMSEAFVTADFYIDESLPSSPATDSTTRRKLAEVSASLQEKIAQTEIVNQQLSELQLLNAKLAADLSESSTNNFRLREFLLQLVSTITQDTETMASESELQLIESKFEDLLTSVKLSLDSKRSLESEVEQRKLENTALSNELEKCRQTANELDKQLQDKQLLQDKLSVLEESLVSKDSTITNLHSEMETLTVEYNSKLALQKVEVEKEMSDKQSELEETLKRLNGEHNELKNAYETCLSENRLLGATLEQSNARLDELETRQSLMLDRHKQVFECLKQLFDGDWPEDADSKSDDISQLLTDVVKKMQTKQLENVSSLTEKHKLELDAVQVECDLLKKRLEHCTETHTEEMERLTKSSDEARESFERERQLLESQKSRYEVTIEELNNKLTQLTQNENDESPSFCLTDKDYLPVERHLEVVEKLKAELQLADEQKTLELKQLENSYETKLSELKESLIKKYEQELQAVKPQNAQELDLMRQSSVMTDSVIPAAVTSSSLLHKAAIPSQEIYDLERQKLEEKLADLALNQIQLEQVKQQIKVGSCKEGDVVLFTWNETHRYYMAVLPESFPKHFLHSGCLPVLGLSADGNVVSGEVAGVESSRKSILLQITHKEHCLAKKPSNRFRVAQHEKFFRVKAKLHPFMTPAQSDG